MRPIFITESMKKFWQEEEEEEDIEFSSRQKYGARCSCYQSTLIGNEWWMLHHGGIMFDRGDPTCFNSTWRRIMSSQSTVARNSSRCRPRGNPMADVLPCHRGQKNCWKSVGWIPTDLNPSQVWLYALKGARDLRETAQHYAGLPFWILIEFPPLCRPFSFLRIWFLVLFFLLFGLFFLRILYTFVYDNYYKSISYSSYT